MRMIDADRLLRDPYFQEDRYPESHLLRMAIAEQPTVEVTRCENCERSQLDGFYCCGADMMPPHKTFPHCFCSYGERKE